MTLRRFVLAMAIVSVLCVWGFAHSGNHPNPSAEPVLVENGAGTDHDEAAARYRANQCVQWRHIAVGNHTSNR